MLHDLFCSVAIQSFSGIYSIQELLCYAASCLFQESILFRNCSALQHPVFSRNLFYPGTALLCRILSFPEIYPIQELLCSAASCLFQESFYPGTALQHPIFSRNLSIQEMIYSTASSLFQESILSRNCCALLHPVFSRSLSIQELLCPSAFPLFHKSRLYRNCSALHHPVFAWNLFNPETALLHAVSRLFQEYIPSRNCSALQHPVYYRNIFHLGTALLCSIVCFPEIYSTHELLLSSAEPCRNKINALISKLQ